MDRGEGAGLDGLAGLVGLFTAHPRSVGETYLGHLRFASRFGASMVVGGVGCMVHGLLPFCLTTSGSRRVRALHDLLSRQPGRHADSTLAVHDAGADIAFNWSI